MYDIHIQQAGDSKLSPKPKELKAWAKNVLKQILPSAEVTIRLVGEEEMAVLNEAYRKKKGPTNVLSFPFSTHPAVQLKKPLLGDVIICSSIVNQQAKDQHKLLQAHWAHMVTHGLLHLLGYDHVQDKDAEVMEVLEIKLLKNLGYENPYHDDGKDKARYE